MKLLKRKITIILAQLILWVGALVSISFAAFTPSIYMLENILWSLIVIPMILVGIVFFVIIPLSVLYLMRKDNLKKFDKIYQSINYIAMAVAIYLVILNILSLILWLDIEDFYFGIKNFLGSISLGVLSVILIYLIMGLTKSLAGEKFVLLTPIIKKNSQVMIVTVAVLLFLAAYYYFWKHAEYEQYFIESGNLWWADNELARSAIRDAYDMAFKKLVILGGFIFASVSLLLKTLPTRDKF